MLRIKHFEFNPFQENTYLLYNEFNECFIIDAGNYFPEETEEIIGFIEENKLRPTKLINTHCHLDHVFGNKVLAEKYDLPLHLHAGELKVLEYAPTLGLMYQVPFDNYMGEYVFLKEGEQLRLGEDVLEILYTPGHSPASISFYHAGQGILLSGDVLFQGSIGRYDLPGGNLETLLSSIHTQLLTLPDETIVYPGHGPSTTIGEERRENPYLR